MKHHQNRRRTEGSASCIADTDGRSGHFGTGLTVQNAHTGDIVIHQKTHNKITFSGEILLDCREPPLTGIEKRVQLIFVQAGTAAMGIDRKLPAVRTQIPGMDLI